jgi:hypothetical protein
VRRRADSIRSTVAADAIPAQTGSTMRALHERARTSDVIPKATAINGAGYSSITKSDAAALNDVDTTYSQVQLHQYRE